MNKSKLVLASASPRRLELLNNMGFVPNEIIPADIDETPKKHEKPNLYVKRMAIEKAQKVASGLDSSAYILAADSIACVGTRILGKPKNRDEARDMILLMKGRRHRVYTGVCVIPPDGTLRHRVVLTHVKFKNASKPEIEEYLDTENWKGRAGAYGLQEDMGGFVISITGSYSNVIGLPMFETKNLLVGSGFKS